MVKRHNRLLVAFHVATDAVLGMLAFLLAYVLRFDSGLIPVTRGYPPLEQYLNVLPFIALIVPLGFQLQGLYRLRRGRSRIDDFFNVLVGSIFAVVLGVVGTLYFQAYYVPDELKERGVYEVSQLVWGLFLVSNIALGYLSRKFIREALERRWIAGVGLRRVLIAGAGDLGRMVADRIIEHRELGYQIACCGVVPQPSGQNGVPDNHSYWRSTGCPLVCCQLFLPNPTLPAAKHWEAARLPVILDRRKRLQSFHVFLGKSEIQQCIVFHVRGVYRFGKRDRP